MERSLSQLKEQANAKFALDAALMREQHADRADCARERLPSNQLHRRALLTEAILNAESLATAASFATASAAIAEVEMTAAAHALENAEAEARAAAETAMANSIARAATAAAMARADDPITSWSTRLRPVSSDAEESATQWRLASWARRC